MRRRRSPVRESGNGFLIELGEDEALLVTRLLDELRQLLTNPSPDSSERLLTVRLFPVVHPDDEVAEAEYQRLMRDELITSRLAGIEVVQAVLGRSGRKVTLEESEMTAFVQAINSVRLVLGTVLDVDEDDDLDPSGELVDTPEYQLYGYLSWLLDSAVRAMSGGLPGA